MEPQRLSYDEAIAVLRAAATFGINPSLEGVTELVRALGSPDDSFASIQITGTNGKTSTARLTSALLRAEGRKVGLYTSPHLERYPERIEVGGEVVADADFARAIGAALAAAKRMRGADAVGTVRGFTEFELLTAAALWLFADVGVDIAVLEVGLGGRWDATSVVAPKVAVVTGVGLDHTAILGETVQEIAADKASIIKPGSAAVLGPGTAGLEAVFLKRAEAVGAQARAVREGADPSPLAEKHTVRYRVTKRPVAPRDATVVDVHGVCATYEVLALRAPSYQAANLATAVATAEAALGRALATECARAALAAVALPGRFELVRVQPPLIVDGSHNPQAAAALAAAIREAFPDAAARPLVLLGVLADKDALGIVRALAPVASGFAVTRPRSQRALSASDLADVVAQATGTRPREFGSVAEALRMLVADQPGPLVVTGSLVTAGEARSQLLGGVGHVSETPQS